MNSYGGIEIKLGESHKSPIDHRVGTTFYFDPPNDGEYYFALFRGVYQGNVITYDEGHHIFPETKKEFDIRRDEDFAVYVVATKRGKPFYVKYLTSGREGELIVTFNKGNPSALLTWDIPEKLTITKGQKYSALYWVGDLIVDEYIDTNKLETSSANTSVVAFIRPFLIEGKSVGTTKIKLKSKVTGLESELTVEVINPPTFEGKGTVEDPYKIRNPTDLWNVRYDLNAVYEQVNDIYLTGIEWSPIGSIDNPFTGVYFGRDNSIHDLKITKRFNLANAQIGLFSNTMDAAISDLTLIKPYFETTYYVQSIFPDQVHSKIGCLTGIAFNTSIWNCHVVDGYLYNLRDSNDTGGLVGRIDSCYIERCGVNVENWNDYRIGGLIGSAYNSYLINTFAISKMYLFNGNYGGGLIGYAGQSEIVSSYAVTTVSFTDHGYILGIIGNDGDYGNYVTSSYYDVDVLQVNRGLGTALSTSEMKVKENFRNWDFTNVWSIHENESYPFFGIERRNCLSVRFPIKLNKMNVY